MIITKLGVPSFVVTLAGLLAWNGAVLLLIGDKGTVIIQNSFFIGFANDFLPSATAWILAVAGIVLYAGDAVLAARATHARGARQRPGRGPVAAHRRVRRSASWRSPTCAIRTAASRT